MGLTAGLALLVVSVAMWALATVGLVRDHPDARVPLWHRPLRLSRRAMLLRATAGACGVLGVAFLEHPLVWWALAGWVLATAVVILAPLIQHNRRVGARA